ncbi:hypothetical protein GE09DRAFT_1250871, partial [Coniochaeta sp. 2T2.1]
VLPYDGHGRYDNRRSDRRDSRSPVRHERYERYESRGNPRRDSRSPIRHEREERYDSRDYHCRASRGPDLYEHDERSNRTNQPDRDGYSTHRADDRFARNEISAPNSRHRSSMHHTTGGESVHHRDDTHVRTNRSSGTGRHHIPPYLTPQPSSPLSILGNAELNDGTLEKGEIAHVDDLFEREHTRQTPSSAHRHSHTVKESPPPVPVWNKSNASHVQKIDEQPPQRNDAPLSPPDSDND